MKLVVAIWSKKVYKRRDTEDLWSRRFSYLTALVKVNRIAREIEPERLNSAPEIHTIFACPEYFYSTMGHSDNPSESESRALTESDKDNIVSDLAVYSRCNPGILTAPGTISFRRKAIRPFWKDVMRRSEGKDTTPRADKDMEQLSKLNPTGKKKYDESVRLAKEHLTNVQERVRNEGLHVDLMKDDNLDLIVNRTYLYLNGNKVYRYSKLYDFNEAMGPSPGVFLPGLDPGSGTTELIGGLRFGLEICADHENQALSAFCPRTKKGFSSVPTNPVDVHIIMSASVKTGSTSSALKVGGIIVHASSEAECSGVWQKAKSALTSVDAIEEKGVEVAGDPIKFYAVEVPTT